MSFTISDGCEGPLEMIFRTLPQTARHRNNQESGFRKDTNDWSQDHGLIAPWGCRIYSTSCLNTQLSLWDSWPVGRSLWAFLVIHGLIILLPQWTRNGLYDCSSAVVMTVCGTEASAWSLGSRALGEAGHHARSIFKQLCEETPMKRHTGLLPICLPRAELKWKQILQPLRWVVSADLTVTSLEFWARGCPAKTLLHFWPWKLWVYMTSFSLSHYILVCYIMLDSIYNCLPNIQLSIFCLFSPVLYFSIQLIAN